MDDLERNRPPWAQLFTPRVCGDSSLTCYAQHAAPQGEEANWLPTPAGDYYLVMRLYEPADALLSGGYQLPTVELFD